VLVEVVVKLILEFLENISVKVQLSAIPGPRVVELPSADRRYRHGSRDVIERVTI